MANASRQSEFDTGQTLLETTLEGEFDYIYNCINGTNAIDISINGDLEVKGGDITLTNAATAIAVKDNTDAALSIKVSTTEYFAVDTTNGSEQVNIVGNAIIKSDQQLTSADFPNSTTLYVWNMASTSSESQTDIVGSKALAVAAGALTAGNDVLGNSKYCAFDGSTYLNSADAVFDTLTGTFSCGGWIFSADWTPAGNMALLSKASGTEGWRLTLQTDGTVIWVENNAQVGNAFMVTHLTASTWHHFAVSRTNAGNVVIYLDGEVVYRAAATTITDPAGNNLEIAAFAGGSAKFTGRVDELFIHNATALTADQVRKLYARSAKKFAILDANSAVVVPQNVSSGVYTPTLTNTTNIAASTAYACTWSRVGNVVTVGFKADVDPVAASPTASQLNFTLPIACSTTPVMRGSANCGTANQTGNMQGLSATTAYLEFQAQTTANVAMAGTFQYIIN